MTTDRHERIKAIFTAICGLEPGSRRRRLDELCAEDPSLRPDVESLLRHDAAPAIDFDSVAISVTESSDSYPAHIGAYRIESVLGRGGMGVVYRAEQSSPRRAVALKLIRPEMTSPDMLRRFEHEVDVLGRLQHPGIAQVFEVGRAEVPGVGEQPYFTMELVAGEPLHIYADRHGLDRDDRVELLAKICDAVQHAHQNGVIHRDLKPANILVAEPVESSEDSARTVRTGQPKVLDFGVARSLAGSGDTALTTAGQLVGTMDYMSPEQCGGRSHEVDARSDVYSLGVIGYELLAGRRPFDTSEENIAHAARRIVETEPPRLSAVDRALRGDLETIIGKAMEKEPERRYQSASELASDLDRYRRSEAVLARTPSTAYSLRKFARRHRGVVFAISALVVAVVAGTAISTAGWLRAVAENRRADRDRETMTAINAFLSEMLLSVDPDRTPDVDLPVRVVLDRAAAQITEAFPDRPQVRAGLHATIGRAYTSLGLYATAREHLTTALALHDEAPEERNPAVRDVLHALSINDKHAGTFASALAARERLVELDRAALGPDHVETLNSRVQQAVLLASLGRFKEAEPIFDDALARWRKIEPDGSSLFGVALNEYGTFLSEVGRFEEAASRHDESLAMHVRFDGPESLPVALAHANLAGVMNDLNRIDEALEHLDRARAIRSVRVEPDHPLLASLHHLEAMLRMSEGRMSDAAAAFERSIAAYRDRATNQLNLAISLKGLGDVRNVAGRSADAATLLEESLAILRREVGEDHPLTAATLNSLASAYHRQGRVDDARRTAEEAIASSRAVHGDSSADLATTMHMLATLELKAGEYATAQERFRRAMAMFVEHRPDDHVSIAYFHENIAVASGRLGDIDAARAGFERALALRKAHLPPMHPNIASSLQNLSAVLRVQGDFAAAEPAARSALEVWNAVFDGPHPQKAACLVVLGAVIRDGGAPHDAVEVLRHALTMREALFEPTSLEVAEAQMELSSSLRMANESEDEALALLDSAWDVLQDPAAPTRLHERCVAERTERQSARDERLDGVPSGG